MHGGESLLPDIGLVLTREGALTGGGGEGSVEDIQQKDHDRQSRERPPAPLTSLPPLLPPPLLPLPCPSHQGQLHVQQVDGAMVQMSRYLAAVRGCRGREEGGRLSVLPLCCSWGEANKASFSDQVRAALPSLPVPLTCRHVHNALVRVAAGAALRHAQGRHDLHCSLILVAAVRREVSLRDGGGGGA